MPSTKGDFQAGLQQLNALLDQAEQDADPARRAQLQQIVGGLLDLHYGALERMIDTLAAGNGTGEKLLDSWIKDDSISAMLLLHGLHPLSAEARIHKALVKVGPYLASHGGHVELVEFSPQGRLTLRLEGSCHGCPSSRVTLQSTIEQEIYAAAPEVTEIVVEGLVEQTAPTENGFVPIGELGIHGAAVVGAAAL
jgi:Fe-S cluster biogenesis protein NfuA